MNFTRRLGRLAPSERPDSTIDRYLNPGAQPVTFEQLSPDSRPDPFEIVYHLSHRGTIDFDRSSAAGQLLQQRRDEYQRHLQRPPFQMAAITAGGFMGSRRMRT